jgi:hypothetical protein
MTKRRLSTHEECLRAFSLSLQREIKENLKFWDRTNPDAADSRAEAFALVIATLKNQLDQHSIPLVDVGLADYELPRAKR